MKTRCINTYKQRQFYHLSRAKVCGTQTMPNPYIRKKQDLKQDEILIKIRNSIRETKEIWAELLQVSLQLQQAERKRKQIEIAFIEHYFGRPLTEEEKQKLMLYL